MTYDIYSYALEILKKRENYHGKMAHQTDSHTVEQMHLSEAAAYNSAWWILFYATHENWEALEQYDYYKAEEVM